MKYGLSDDSNYLLNVYNRLPLDIEKAEGCYLIDYDGNRYLDLFGGIAVNNLGYGHQRIKDAIELQCNNYLHLSNYFVSSPVVGLAKRLVENSFASKVFFTNSGTEANEAAVKLARKYGKIKHKDKIEVVSFYQSFHGRTIGALSLTGQKKYQQSFEPLMPGVVHVEFDNVGGLIDHVSDKTCAVFLEVIQGESGIHELSQEFIRILTRLAKEHDFLIIVDEIQTGLGRTGDLFAYQRLNFIPDVVTIAKSLGGGLPLGAMLVSEPLEDVFDVGEHGSTFGGNPVACALGDVIVETILEPNFQKSVKAKGYYILFHMRDLMKEYPTIIKDLRGRGLMIGIDVGDYAKEIQAKALEKKVLLNVTNKTVIRLLPPLTITYEELDVFFGVFEEIVKSLV